MGKILWIVMLALLLPACDKAPDNKRIEWQQLALPGKTLTLIHPTKLRVYPFGQDSTVVATIGNDSADGAVAGPILFWGIQGKSLIISINPVSSSIEDRDSSSEADADAVEIFSEPTLEGDVLEAMTLSGERASYRLSQS